MSSSRIGFKTWEVVCDLMSQQGAAIERVRDLHRPRDVPDFCPECGRDWPCPTIRALDGEQTQIHAVRLPAEPGPSPVEQLIADPEAYHQQAVAIARRDLGGEP